ncbi:fumarylacetoacetate hydrolase family protein [Wenxinia saemankumensis]|uniref:Fumarylpyruvate hydrolase n=1 Tax=Wenxinia saemankumensis TaxID=1447782 RepID=A0A1M6E4T1_9RHOB|nr:fumarylacetoacetate hydrolase family protein [Wenxinia saemankumensis]SHI80451.1 fumarylpyruvate hydrolase [Wenxinia saemankumensis]
MSNWVFTPEVPAHLDTVDGARYRVRRIFCIGRNYAAHAAEMGNEVDRAAPFHFTKTPDHLVRSPAATPYPRGTADLHHEIEYVIALGEGGAVWGHATGLDMTRRDLQGQAKDKRRPWDAGKDFEGSAVIGPLSRQAPAPGARITLEVDGQVRQDATLDEMIHDVPALLRYLSGLHELGPGDLVMTGTPAGVGAVGPGARLVGQVAGLEPVDLTLG